MFFEDVNTLYEKYKYCSFWYELSYDDIVDNDGKYVDFFEIDDGTVISHNSFVLPICYRGESSKPSGHGSGSITPELHTSMGDIEAPSLSPDYSLFIYVYCDFEFVSESSASIGFYPVSSMNLIRCGSESDTVKVYLSGGSVPESVVAGTGKYVNGSDWDTDLGNVTVSSDGEGSYIELTANRDDEFTIIQSGDIYFCGKILNYKSLPTITFNTLYRGNTQTIEVYFDGELIDSKYYDLLYQNQVLTDNKISIGEDVTGLELEVYLKHPEYISTKLKYNLSVDYYKCENQADIEAGLELGLTTIQVTNDLTLSNIALNGIKIISGGDWWINLSDCELSNILFNNLTIYMLDSKSRFINCIFDYCKLRVEIVRLKYYMVNSTITNSEILACFLVCSENCIIDNNQMRDVLIFSDDMITIIKNQFSLFNGFTDYYPNTLYLTGDFDCKDNLFIQQVQYPHFSFDVALIKTIPETDIDEFIRLNNFDIMITVDEEEYNGLFYSLIDDSKLHYKEIE